METKNNFEKTEVSGSSLREQSGLILAIESSCDDTAAAVCKDGIILSNFVANQAVHQQYGYTLPAEQENALVEQVAQTLNSDAAMRTRIIASMDEILNREF